ncbi:intraflagellar transport protein [Catenaria anguillulae PL171]|uniref:Intraflagellar transport protein n=1 Tax=Catenaria anguillulae PL171 TaxID=765915 RepID=A0A1Y2I041_9FUNG|nr:intraflagellar transport protein [Catenaria anguillulae PL171]
MQIRHLKTFAPASDGIAKLACAAWSPNGLKIAIANADRVVVLFDENGEKKDKFATKPADANVGKSYTITGLAFSPDSTKLAVAQSEGSVFVYRIGAEWGEKKSICNKFIHSSQVTCMTWPKEQHGVLAFGLADGKVKLGNLKTNKAATLYQTDSYVTSIASSLDGNGIVTGHADGSLHQFLFDDGKGGSAQSKLTQGSRVANGIAWALQSIVVADMDKGVTFFNLQGRVQQQFEYGRDPNEPDLVTIMTSPTGLSVLVGSINKLRVYNYNTQNSNGSKLVLGSITGELDMFDCCLKRTRYKGTFEFTYVSPSQVLVKRLATGARILLKSTFGSEFIKINIFQDQYLVAHTEHTLCLGDLASCKLSEIQWQSQGTERFHFAYPGVCMIFNAGELLLIEYGVNDVLGSCRTEFTSPHLLSVRLNERQSGVKAVAYLVDTQTIHIMDLNPGTGARVIATVHHDTRVDWLELSGKGNKLLFRDVRKHLHLLDVASHESVTLLPFATYVQWVPNSDVIVAQSRNSLCVWYAVDSPDRVTMHPIKGDVLDIVRENGATNVIVDEGIANVTYTLDEALIEFGTAMDDLDWCRALALLETLELTPETEGMWNSLGKVALQNRKLALAERCFAAVGDVAKTMYMRKINDAVDQLKLADPMLDDPCTHFSIRAKLAVMEGDFKSAERVYLEQGQVQAAMEMYQELHKWDASIKVAELAHHPDVDHLRQQYFDWLIQSGQEEKAAELREAESNWMAAIQLYLKARMPSRAAMLLKQRNLLNNTDLVERTANALVKADLWEKAGDLYLVLGQRDRALEAFEKGHCFKAAIDLCRIHDPSRIVQLEVRWGDYLVSTRLETAIAAKSWNKATAVADSLDPNKDPTVRKLCCDLAHHFQTVSDLPRAERYFIKASQPLDAISMYNQAGQWDKAYKLATSVMTADDVYHLYTQMAHEKESAGQVKDAERLYLLLGEPDLAINMYKNLKDYDRMVELVALYHKDLLGETHVFLGKTQESAQNYRQAEHHYLQANDWKSAVNMYCSNHLFEDAHRVAKLHGGQHAAKQVAYLWARSLGGESGAKLLIKHNLLDYAIDFASENAAFDFAFELCKYASKSKEADAAFIKANKPKEAILMHIHNEDWDAAQRVAEVHDPTSVSDVLCGRAKLAYTKGDALAAEALCLQAQRPDAMLIMYKEAGKWADALRFAKEYVPAKAAQLAVEHDAYLRDRSDTSRDDLVSTGRMLEQQGDPQRAIDVYLKVTASTPADVSATAIPCWVRAAELALKFTPGAKAQAVAKTVASKLADAGRHDGAGDVLALAELYRDACEAVQPALQPHIDSLYVAHLKRNGAVDALAALDVDAACQVHAQRGDWDQCLAAAAASKDTAVLQRHLMLYANAMLAAGSYDKLLTRLTQYGAPTTQGFLDLYGNVVSRILSDSAGAAGQDGDSSKLDAVLAARELLKKLANSLGKSMPTDLRSLLVVAHLQYMFMYCKSKAKAVSSPAAGANGSSTPAGTVPLLLQYAAKHAISLLRYPERPTPIDRALFTAGTTCREAGMERMAFTLLNRYLDVSDAIDEQDPDSVAALASAPEFDPATTGCDMPVIRSVPKSQSVEEGPREAARDWVLSVSLERRVQAQLDSRVCDKCNAKVYDASLRCGGCKCVWEACIVSGYPVLTNSVKCPGCNMAANKDDWNRFVMQEKKCPWCLTTQGPSYSLKG